jgi:hypothetical protein
MSHVHPQGEWPEFDPPPDVPTIEEIELADALRHELEFRYLGKPVFATGEGFAMESGWRTATDD